MPGTRIDVLSTMYKFFEFRRRAREKRMIIFMTEGTEFTGLADRFRCIVSAYVVAKAHNLPFYIYHDKGFQLERYLQPAEIQWQIEKQEIRRGFNNVAFLWFQDKWPQLTDTKREYHWYWSPNLFDLHVIPTHIAEKHTFSSLFWSLFKMSPHLSALVDAAMQQLTMQENEYIAVHIRFLNFFEAVEERCTAINGTGSPEEQAEMIKRVNATLETIYESTGKPIVLFSDSNKFLSAQHPDYIYQLPGQVGHILCHEDSETIIDKAFIDMMVIAKAAKVYSITGENIYGGGFAHTASYIGNKPYVKVPLNS